MLQGFLLGISNSATCVASCAPVMLPYLMSDGKTVRKNLLDLAFFLSGRLTGYISFAILAWFTGKVLLNDLIVRGRFIGIAFIALSVTMIIYNLKGNHHQCRYQSTTKSLNKILQPKAWYYPYIFGLLTGVNICPPFLMVFTGAMDSSSLLGSIFFFLTFFIGTSIFFIPLSLVGSLKNKPEFKTVGELSLYIIAAYYLYRGILTIGGAL
jgi:sulfite exporter TauE/SafE